MTIATRAASPSRTTKTRIASRIAAPSTASAASGVGLDEPPGVAHLRPDPGLADGEHLLDVVPVVMDPLAEEIADRQLADRLMDAGPGQVIRPERTDEVDALHAKRQELGEELSRVA